MTEDGAAGQSRVDDGGPPSSMNFLDKHHLSARYKEGNAPHHWVFAVSENGWTTNKLSLQ
jgi:hypothetical protein